MSRRQAASTLQYSVGITAASLVVGSLLCMIPSPQQAVAAPDGAELFAKNCAACHAAGKNIINPKKPVIGSKMLDSKKAFKDYLLKPTGTMPPSPKIADNDADLTALYKYCKSLK